MNTRKSEKEDLYQISITGARAITLLGLLIRQPRSLEEIRQAFLKQKYINNSNSDDILRIDINTLRNMGCAISRADRRTNKKYVLLDQPFKLEITQEEILAVKRVYNRLKENADINFLLSWDSLFKKLIPYIDNQEIIEQLLGISSLKKYSIEIIEQLKKACKNKEVVKLVYKSPVNKTTSEISIVTDKVILQNNKLYLYGVDKNTKSAIYLNVKRILKILSISKNDDDSVIITPVKVKFKLKQFGITGLDYNEKIIDGSVEEGFVVEGQYHNEFIATQRILSFGANCTVYEPEEFKYKIINILKQMKEVYSD